MRLFLKPICCRVLLLFVVHCFVLASTGYGQGEESRFLNGLPPQKGTLGRYSLEVPAAGEAVRVTFSPEAGGDATVTVPLKVQPRWFAYRADGDEIWLFDGEGELLVVRPAGKSSVAVLRPREVKGPVPPEVLRRIPRELRDELKK